MTTQVSDNKISAVEFETATRVHVAINVSNLEQSLPFYKVLFAQEPTKLRQGYAKFEVAQPPVNFTLNEHGETIKSGGALSHFGIQVKSTAAVLAAKERFTLSGLVTFDEDNVTCCYAVQDKVWVTDPDGNNWEVFVVLEADAPSHSANRNPIIEAQCACDTGATTQKVGSPVTKLELVANPTAKCC